MTIDSDRHSMRGMSKSKKRLIWIGAVLFALIVLGSVGGSKHAATKTTTATTEQVTTATDSTPKPEAKIVLVASKSYCTPDPTDAYIYFTVVFSNRGDADGSVQATPRARYSDGHTSSDYNVYTGIKIPANRWSGGGGVFFTYLRFSYNAQDHFPLSCTLSYDTGGRFADDVPIAMKR